ncbi:MAG TPA: class I SAM-dependent methyltransferase [Acidimicrobiia bacterium]|nr:class I SAM-dependent methyltransferase [Acidimicrobiia bacterium]
MSESHPHERHNREFWDADADDYQSVHGGDLTARPLAWGAWRIPESDLGVLGDVGGLDVLELGCGAGQWSIALAARAARQVGLDQSLVQLKHAVANSDAARVTVPLVAASGEAVPFRDASFDVVFCDHGAMSFCDPSVTVPEVSRLLRPGGLLAFCQASPLLYLTWDERRERQDTRLHRSYFELGRLELGDGTIDFQIPHGEWFRLFREHGFVVEDLIELRPPEDATTTYDDFAPYEWARRWPAEQIWKARKRALPTRPARGEA